MCQVCILLPKACKQTLMPRMAEGHSVTRVISTERQKYSREPLHISHLEGTVERLGCEVVLIKAQVIACGRLAMSGSIVMSNGLSLRVRDTETLQTVQASKLRLQKVHCLIEQSRFFIDFDHTNPRNDVICVQSATKLETRSFE